MANYNSSENFKASLAKYNNSEKGKATKAKYNSSEIGKAKKAVRAKRYRKGDKGQLSKVKRQLENNKSLTSINLDFSQDML